MLRNLAVNPSFESSLAVPVGAVRSREWSARGDWSLHVPPPQALVGYGHGSYGHGEYGHGPSEDGNGDAS